MSDSYVQMGPRRYYFYLDGEGAPDQIAKDEAKISAAPELYEAETLGRALWEALAGQWSRLTAAQQSAAWAYFQANRSALAKADGKVTP